METTGAVSSVDGEKLSQGSYEQNEPDPTNVPEFQHSMTVESTTHQNSEAMLIDNTDISEAMNDKAECTSIKTANIESNLVADVNNELDCADNNTQCIVTHDVKENDVNKTDAERTKTIATSMHSEKSVNTDNSSSENVPASEISVRNITSSEGCNVEPVQDKVMINSENEINGNAVTNVDDKNVTESNDEAMITEDSLENNEMTITSDTDNQSNVVLMGPSKRDSVVLDAMNKDQSWKTDSVYQKDLSSLQLLCDYGSDSDEDNNLTSNKVEKTQENLLNTEIVIRDPAVQQDYRKPDVETLSDSEDESDSSEDEDSSSSSSTATSSSSSEESEDSDNTSGNECVIVEEKKPAAEVPKTKGELGLEDLPPIEDLHISVPESECVEIGRVLSIVDSLVVVQSIKGCPALDLDSVLFLDHGQDTLGQVFDVFGKVGEACYCVRFNSKDHALQKGVEIGMPVFYAPRTEHSKFVFLADLMKIKGSDASWEHNNEPPPKFLDYSDDEEERRARKGDKAPCREVEPDETQPRAKKFNKKSPQRGMGRSSGSSRPNSGRSWSTPFNRYPSSPSTSPSPRSGPQPLIRPPSFRTPGPSESHFHNPAAGAPAVPATPSPWAVPPPAVSREFNYNMNSPNIPPPSQPHFLQNQMRPNSFDMNVGGFGQPPPRPQPPPPPPSPSSRNFLMPTSIPGTGPFSSTALNAYQTENHNSFAPNQQQFPVNTFRPDSQPGSFGGSPQRPFGPQGPVFMNRNMPPPGPSQGWRG